MTTDENAVAPGTGAAPWVLGGIISLIGLLGLIAASATGDGPVYVIGLVVFLVSVLSIFALIARFAGRKGPRTLQPDSLPSD